MKKKIITNQQKSRVLLMVAICYMKVKEIKINITHGLDYLFNEEEDYYKPTEVKSAFDDSYMLYESKGDKDLNYRLMNILI